jgi:hypothetical protein
MAQTGTGKKKWIASYHLIQNIKGRPMVDSPAQLWDRPSFLYNGNRGSLPGVKRGRAAHLVLRWRMSRNYTSSRLKRVHGVY